jgi:hypothetical protein
MHMRGYLLTVCVCYVNCALYIDRIVSYLACILEYSDLFVGGADIVDLLMSLLHVLVKFYDTFTCAFGYI